MMTSRARLLLCSVSFAALSASTAHAQIAPDQPFAKPDGNVKSVCETEKCAFLDPSLPPEARARDLVHHMTLEEKVSQTQDRAPGIPRLGVPEYNWWNEALHGVARNGVATVFPQAIGMAATWDPALMHQVADVISTEARAKYVEALKDDKHGRYMGLTYWSPNINIFRDPRWGRGQETYGEDPYLTGQMGMAFVRGMQGDDPKYFKTIATAKHFAVHSGPEPTRHEVNIDPSPHDLEDTYLPAFRNLIVDAKADSIMCAYNAVDGAPACASDLLLKKYLRDAWSFRGYVVSDCDAVDDVFHGHKFTGDIEAADAKSLEAGTDLDCGVAYQHLVQAVKQGKTTEAALDISLERLFVARIRLGMFDPPARVGWNRITPADNNTAAHSQLALKAAEESMVLLKNDGVLPLAPGKKLAVIGPTADTIEVLLGNYNGTPTDPVLPLAGIQKRFGSVTYAGGAPYTSELPSTITAEFLRPGPGQQGQGLKAEYFNSPDLSGAPVTTRVDRTIDFDWSRNSSPMSSLPETGFSVRWSGELLPPAPGDYILHINGLGRPRRATMAEGATDSNAQSAAASTLQGVRYRLFLDGKQVIDGNAEDQNLPIHFADTNPHAIRVDYSQARPGNLRLEWKTPEGALLPGAVAAAKNADVVVVFVGLSANLEGEEMPVKAAGFLGGDRTSLDLPEPQQKLLEALAGTGKPIVVVSTTGSAVGLNWAQDHASAILQAWYPGEQGGTAIAHVLAGDTDPAGRLPVTFYRSAADLPAFEDYSMAHRTYRYFDGPVLFPFGFGLSYTHFEVGAPKLGSTTVKAGEPLTVTATVHNTGKTAGDDVVELYLSPPRTPVTPRYALKSFERVHLGPGESREVRFTLSPRDLSSVDAEGTRAEHAGDYALFVGEAQPSTADLGAWKTHFTVRGEQSIPK